MSTVKLTASLTTNAAYSEDGENARETGVKQKVRKPSWIADKQYMNFQNAKEAGKEASKLEKGTVKMR